jgi:hypothetical protein
MYKKTFRERALWLSHGAKIMVHITYLVVRQCTLALCISEPTVAMSSSSLGLPRCIRVEACQKNLPWERPVWLSHGEDNGSHTTYLVGEAMHLSPSYLTNRPWQ